MKFWEIIVLIILKWLLGQSNKEAEKAGERLAALEKGYKKNNNTA